MDSGHFIAGKNVESLVSQQEFDDTEQYEDDHGEGAEGEIEIDDQQGEREEGDAEREDREQVGLAPSGDDVVVEEDVVDQIVEDDFH